jgi:hypothetical protein
MLLAAVQHSWDPEFVTLDEPYVDEDRVDDSPVSRKTKGRGKGKVVPPPARQGTKQLYDFSNGMD